LKTEKENEMKKLLALFAVLFMSLPVFGQNPRTARIRNWEFKEIVGYGYKPVTADGYDLVNEELIAGKEMGDFSCSPNGVCAGWLMNLGPALEFYRIPLDGSPVQRIPGIKPWLEGVSVADDGRIVVEQIVDGSINSYVLVTPENKIIPVIKEGQDIPGIGKVSSFLYGGRFTLDGKYIIFKFVKSFDNRGGGLEVYIKYKDGQFELFRDETQTIGTFAIFQWPLAKTKIYGYFYNYKSDIPPSGYGWLDIETLEEQVLLPGPALNMVLNNIHYEVHNNAFQSSANEQCSVIMAQRKDIPYHADILYCSVQGDCRKLVNHTQEKFPGSVIRGIDYFPYGHRLDMNESGEIVYSASQTIPKPFPYPSEKEYYKYLATDLFYTTTAKPNEVEMIVGRNDYLFDEIPKNQEEDYLNFNIKPYILNDGRVIFYNINLRPGIRGGESLILATRLNPFITSAPSQVQAGRNIVLTGRRLYVPDEGYKTMLWINGKETPITCLSDSQVRFSAPRAAGTYQVQLGLVDKSWNILASNVVTIQVVVPPAPPAPEITKVVDGARFSQEFLVPGELATIFGDNLGEYATTGVDGVTKLGGSMVEVCGIPSRMVFTSSSQINFRVPVDIPEDATECQVQVNRDFFGTELNSNILTLPIKDHGISVFTTSLYGSGTATPLTLGYWPDGTEVKLLDIFTQNTEDGKNWFLVGPSGIGASTREVRTGDYVTAWATGCGKTNPQIDNLMNGVLAPMTANLSVRVGGVPVDVQYAGQAPGLVGGVCQINFFVPSGTKPNPHWGAVSVNGDSGTTPVTFWIGDKQVGAPAWLWVRK